MRAFCAIVLGIFALADAQPAIAQNAKLDIASCAELKAKELRAQIGACRAHFGCKLVIDAQETCSAAQQFLNRVSAVAVNPKKLTNDDVFEAAAPAPTQDAALLAEIAKMRKLVSEGRSAPTFKGIKLKANNGADVWHEGPVTGKDWTGTAVEVNGNGTVFRQQWVGNRIAGQVHYYFTGTKEMYAGQYSSSDRNGFGALQKPNGEVQVGTFIGGKLSGPVSVTYPDGSTQKQIWSNGYPTKFGPRAAKGEVAIDPLEYERQQAAKAAAETAAAAAKAAEEAAVAAAIAAENKEREDLAFQASLKTLNAGQLFAKADELDQAGKADGARQTRRTLIARFPNSPLAATAAQQMGGGVSAAGGPAIGGAARPAPVTQTSSSSTDPTAGYAAMRNACAGPIATTKSEFRSKYGMELTDQGVGRTIFMMWGHRLSPSTGERQIEATLAQQRGGTAGGRDTPYALANAEMSRCFHREAMRFANAGGATATSTAGAAPSRPASSTSSGTTSGSAPVAGTDPNGAVGCAATPQQSFRNFDNEMARFSRDNPNPGQTRGAQAQFQYMYFYGVRGLSILEKYRSCMSSADFTANTNALTAARDSAKRGCEQLSSSTNHTCPAEMPR